ncbi:MAG: ABC transporter permease [Clostridiales bacterium]|nr:ABC transporter permease [Clostridiales bacterium]
MIRYFVRQVIGLVPLLFLVSAAAFFLIRRLPGDPATAYLNSINAPVTEESLAEVRGQLGLDGSVPEQYGKWLGQVLKGDLGYSYQTKRPVTEELASGLRYTAILAGAALLWILVFSMLFGVFAAARAGRLVDSAIRYLTFLGSAMPKFWLGYLLVQFFSLKWGVLPVQGAANIKCLVLPSFTLACSYIATYTKLLRNSILEVRNQPYVRYARSRGFSARQTAWRHVLPNALTPVCTALGLHLGGILSGAVIVENVFSWPGLGRMCISAVTARNYPIIQGYILLMALIFVLANLISDVICVLLNPRLRFGADEGI